jgi:hypothetical protein
MDYGTTRIIFWHIIVFVSIYRLHMTDVIFIIDNFSLELYFLAPKLSKKRRAYVDGQNWQNCNSSNQTDKLNRSDRSTRLIYMTSLIAPLHVAHRLDQFSYLICPNQTSDEKVMGSENFHDFWTDLHRSEQFSLPVRPV